MPDLSNWGQCGELVPGVVGHVGLTCKNHPNLRWHTKNIAPIGARSIFFSGAVQADGRAEWFTVDEHGGHHAVPECSCPMQDLVVIAE